jgi:hypothetical protein
MTVTEAKELLIDAMNYAAYTQTGVSLYDSDKNRLFGKKHYHSGREVVAPSPWGEGDGFEIKMAELLRWAIKLGATKGKYPDAADVLRSGDHYLNVIIVRSKVLL